MIKISVPEAFSGMSEVDFKVYDYEIHLMQEWANHTKNSLRTQFYLDHSKENIFLHFIDEKDDKVLHFVRFINKNK